MNQWEGRTIEGWGRVGRGGVRREGRVEERERGTEWEMDGEGRNGSRGGTRIQSREF